MRKATVTTAATAAGVILLLSLKPHQNPAPAMAAPPPASPSGTGAASTTTHAPGGTSGTYTGSLINTAYGPVQVSVTISNGRITAIRALRTPSDRPRSQQIAASAVPQLTREALSAQSAHIDAVSGATYTSEGYTRSLQSALDKAGV